ncbi:MAG: hypothetical protein ABEJ92_07175 [Halobacteriales archaeon]
MADDAVEGVYQFFFAWFGLTLAVFPLVATVEATVFGGSLGSVVVLGASVVLTIPAALEFRFSDRNPRLVGLFVAAFVGLYFLAILGQAAVYVAIGRTETVPSAEFVVLLGTYAVAYVLVYRGGWARLRATVAG